MIGGVVKAKSRLVLSGRGGGDAWKRCAGGAGLLGMYVEACIPSPAARAPEKNRKADDVCFVFQSR